MRWLLDPYRGWLRWRTRDVTGEEWVPDACASWCYPLTVAPPLRRLAIHLAQWSPRRLWALRAEGLRWDELRPHYPTELVAPDGELIPWEQTLRRIEDNLRRTQEATQRSLAEHQPEHPTQRPATPATPQEQGK